LTELEKLLSVVAESIHNARRYTSLNPKSISC